MPTPSHHLPHHHITSHTITSPPPPSHHAHHLPHHHIILITSHTITSPPTPSHHLPHHHITSHTITSPSPFLTLPPPSSHHFLSNLWMFNMEMPSSSGSCSSLLSSTWWTQCKNAFQQQCLGLGTLPLQ